MIDMLSYPETSYSLNTLFESDIKPVKVTIGCLEMADGTGSMLIDYLSVRNLELVQNLQSAKSSQSLFGILDHCHAPMGKRLLRANILQPSAGHNSLFILIEDLRTIQDRLDAVQEMTETEDLYHGCLQGYLIQLYL